MIHKTLIRSLQCLMLFLALFGLSQLQAQSNDWYNLDYEAEGVAGASVNKALTLIKGDVVLQPVLVAVIDDGVDIAHPDLKGRIWINPNEIANDGIDNDGNGHVDDVHGWNFLGNAAGENIAHENLEITRLLRPFKERFDGLDPGSIKGKEKKAYKQYAQLNAQYESRVEELQEEFAEFSQLTALYSGALAFAKERMGREDLSLQQLIDYKTADEDERQVFDFLVMAEVQGIKKMIEEGSAYFDAALNYHYNFDFDPRTALAQSENGLSGNAMVAAEHPSHGTHVAGIIAAIRGNDIGTNGIAPNAIIIPVRAVPNGDERDQDIAAAIRYAVDAGAKVINMSFGKGFSPHKELVKEAALYARSKDVLLIHAAGNDGANNDREPNYPDGSMGKRKSLDNWITVAASGPETGEALLADFSNYGRKKVDLLAPGVDILSLAPDNDTAVQSGTSMAAPVVSGVAALVRGINPGLSAKEVKKLLIESARPYPNNPVVFEEGNTPLKKLVRNPAVVDASEAVRMAIATLP